MHSAAPLPCAPNTVMWGGRCGTLAPVHPQPCLPSSSRRPLTLPRTYTHYTTRCEATRHGQGMLNRRRDIRRRGFGSHERHKENLTHYCFPLCFTCRLWLRSSLPRNEEGEWRPSLQIAQNRAGVPAVSVSLVCNVAALSSILSAGEIGGGSGRSATHLTTASRCNTAHALPGACGNRGSCKHRAAPHRDDARKTAHHPR